MSKRSWKQIEDSRDRRLWVTQVFIPVLTGCALWMSDEDRREWTTQKFHSAGAWVKGKVREIVNR